ncbi:radical SAM protein [Clostridium thermobutyricum]|uniref:radical SAM protein n=1 Tax=Clostridium thermobutyricum TaxID=29372 RepID=UPI002941C466|nr:radical SAM protein [Clostridium thermobutyricum]
MYDMPLYRPPSEANSLIIQATLGCSHNKCSFCSMYKGKKFTIKPLEQIKEEILEFRKIYTYVQRIFIADGDALIIPMNDLRELLKFIKNTFKECTRVTMYASPKSIRLKTIDELRELKNLGLEMVYMGIESGSEEILKDINKGATRDEIIQASKKIKESDIKLSATIISGIGGKEKTNLHAKDTGSIISIIKPNYVGVLSLMIEKNTEIEEKVKNDELEILSSFEILKEIKEILKNINTDEKIIFRSNHASNYVSLKGNLPIDKDRLIEDIDWCIENSYIKNEKNRSL